MTDLECVILLVGGFSWVGCAVLCGYVASQKGRSVSWFWTGLLLGVFALIAVAGLPEFAEEETREGIQDQQERRIPEDPEPQE